MLKKETLQTAATVAIGLGVVFLIVGSSQTFQSCIGEHYHHEPSETFQKGVAQFLIAVKAGSACTGEFVHKNAESIIALFTVILGIATWFLWRATKRLVEGAEDTAQRQLRAYVFLDGINLRRLDISDKTQWNIQIAWKNTGGTRTRRLIAKVSHDVLELSKQPLETFDFHDEPDAQTFHGLIGPNQSVNPPPIPVADIHLFGASDDDTALLIWGWAEYQDVFSATIHRTEFGFRVWIEGSILGKSLIRFESTQKHNAADEDCMKPPSSAWSLSPK